jgi:Ca2+-transporting ATPase
MAHRGLRVLGVAKALLASRLPESQTAISFEFIGLVGLADPIRPSVPKAIAECRSAGVRVVMITGDYPATARSIAEQIGLLAGNVTTAAEVSSANDDQLRMIVQTSNIFARVLPEQKLRIIRSLQATGEVVGMTGDGVNDAPALKAADIGIAMGARGTDVAREAASLVLVDDDFTSIVGAIRLGRRIYDNIRKAMSYVFAIHIPIAGAALIPVLAGWPLLLMPLHVVLLELIVDPACSIAFEAEPEEPDVMRRPPREPKRPLFTLREIVINFLQGVGVLAVTIAVYGFALHTGHSEADARALGFSTLVVGNLALVFVNRSWRRSIFDILRAPNPALWWVTATALTLLALAVYVPQLRRLFQFSFLHPKDLAVICGAAAFGVLWFELLKWARRATWSRA